MRTLAPILVLATACTGDMALDAQHPATIAIDADGGTLQGDGVQLDVPAGAVDAAVTLTAFPDTDSVKGLSTISPVWTFGPDGTQFLKPVTVHLALTTQGASPSLWWTKAGDASTFELLDSSVENGWAVAKITHFSDGVVADGDCSCGDASGDHDGEENDGAEGDDGGGHDGADSAEGDDDGAEADDGAEGDDDGAEGDDDGAQGEGDEGEAGHDDDGAEGDDDGAGATCECDGGGGDDAEEGDDGEGDDGADDDGEDDTDGADDPADP